MWNIKNRYILIYYTYRKPNIYGQRLKYLATDISIFCYILSKKRVLSFGELNVVQLLISSQPRKTSNSHAVSLITFSNRSLLYLYIFIRIKRYFSFIFVLFRKLIYIVRFFFCHFMSNNLHFILYKMNTDTIY